MFLKRRHVLSLLRQFNRLRRPVRRLGQRFCESHPYCLACNFRVRVYQRWLVVRDWLGQTVERGHENRLIKNSHYLLWIITATWLIVLGIHLVNYNFGFLNSSRIFDPVRARHPVFDFFMTHIHPILWIATLAWLREITHEMFRLPQDTVRATRLIRRWLVFYGVFRIFCWAIRHPFIETPAVSDTTSTLFILLIMKWGIRKTRQSMGLPVGAVPLDKRKKTESVAREIVKFLLRSRLK